jgi:hypothetical protein
MFSRDKRSHVCYVDEISVKLWRNYCKLRGTFIVYKYACTNKIFHFFNPNLFVSVVKVMAVIIWIEGGGLRWRQRGWGMNASKTYISLIISQWNRHFIWHESVATDQAMCTWKLELLFMWEVSTLDS